MMNLFELTKGQISTIYKEHVIDDFPAKERKSLSVVLEGVESGSYSCYGLFSDKEIVGYVFFERVCKDYLVDYIATFPEKRNNGLGSQLISVLHESLKEADSIILEVEDPAFAKTEENRSIQERRLNFYLRNNCVDTGVRVICFDVHYIIIEIPVRKTHSPEEVRALYERQYHAILPDKIYRKNIIV